MNLFLQVESFLHLRLLDLKNILTYDPLNVYLLELLFEFLSHDSRPEFRTEPFRNAFFFSCASAAQFWALAASMKLSVSFSY
jgi:hypothetical protein